MNAQAEKIFERFMKTDFGKRLLAEADAEEIDAGKRKQTAGELRELRRTRNDKIREVQQIANDAHREVEALQEEIKKAAAIAGQAEGKVFSVTWAIDQRIREAEFYLMKTAPAKLKTELESARTKLERVRAMPIEAVAFPDIPEAMGMHEADRPTTSGIKERVGELATIERNIKSIEERILGGE